MSTASRPYLGFGLGLRPDHYDEILNSKPNIDWFEIISENYINTGGKPRYYLEQISERYPIVMHGVSLSIGSTDNINYTYLKQLKQLANQIKPKWISDHLCWTGINDLNMHDLLPLPYNNETIKHVVDRIKKVQDYLGRQILIENVSSYLTYSQSTMSEWEFLATIAENADCHILLDINNVYVSGFNHKFNPITYIKELPFKRIYQIHLAGHSNMGNYILDTHDAPIISEVWNLYKQTIKITGNISTIIERDDNIPPLSELITELDFARDLVNE